MKNIIFFILILSCSAPKPTTDFAKLKADDDRIMESLHDEPLRMGKKEVQKEGIITTEIWRYSEEHGTPDNTVETLMYKNGKLISHTISDSASGQSFSRQFQDGKVIELTETKIGKTSSLYFDENEKLKARINIDGKTAECFKYTNGENPRSEKLETCEREFNTAP